MVNMKINLKMLPLNL